MSEFQENIQFSSVEEFLDFLPDHERLLVDQLREIIFDAIPNVEEKLAYNVPFYYRNSRICFIWPSAVPWGKVEKGGVIIGFAKGHLLSDELNYLEKGDRRQVYTKTFFNPDEIDEDVLKTYLWEAVELDES